MAKQPLRCCEGCAAAFGAGACSCWRTSSPTPSSAARVPNLKRDANDMLGVRHWNKFGPIYNRTNGCGVGVVGVVSACVCGVGVGVRCELGRQPTYRGSFTYMCSGIIRPLMGATAAGVFAFVMTNSYISAAYMQCP